MHNEEIAILIGIVLLLLSVRWFNSAFKRMVDGIAALTKEALRFEQAIKEEKNGRD